MKNSRFHYKIVNSLMIGVILMTLSAVNTVSIASQATATFAGGCFWCLQEAFAKTPGVLNTQVGYTGGHLDNPTYKQVSAGGSGHVEAVQVVFNTQKITYSQLLKVFWHNVDPFDATGQFCDKGDSYLSIIFYHTQAQKQAAMQSKIDLEQKGFKGIATKILPAQKFYKAEDYHQNYYKKNPLRYKYYKYTCGRAARLKQIWGNP